MTARITIPPQVQALLRQLNAAGFSAYAAFCNNVHANLEFP